MHRFHPAPNLLLIGGPKTGTTSLMHWLSIQDDIHHPWPNESHFLMAGAAEFPTSPLHPKGTAILPPTRIWMEPRSTSGFSTNPPSTYTQRGLWRLFATISPMRE